MVENDDGPLFDIKKYITGSQRKVDFLEWSTGKGELTEEEQEIASRFGGANKDVFITQAIKLHRKKLINNILNPDPDSYSDKEKELVKRFGGPSSERFARQFIRNRRKRMLNEYFSGEDFNITE